jgi:predicted HNH restriction endonuclease
LRKNKDGLFSVRAEGSVDKYSRNKVDPFKEELEVSVTRRLLEGKGYRKTDLQSYYKTSWFEGLTRFCIDYYKRCQLCGKPAPAANSLDKKGFTVHHNNYTHLFDENINQDVTLLCSRCHGNYHRGRRHR